MTEALRIVTENANAHFYRVFWHTMNPVAFPKTPLSDPWRFTPFQDRKGKIVQGLYMADSALGAIKETAFRKHSSIPEEIPFFAVADRNLIKISLKRDLQLAVLTDEFLLNRLGYNPVSDNDYPQCRDLARLLHVARKDIDGLSFGSYQTDAQSSNVVLFSDRITRRDLRLHTATSKPLLDQSNRRVLLHAADTHNKLLCADLRKIIYENSEFRR